MSRKKKNKKTNETLSRCKISVGAPFHHVRKEETDSKAARFETKAYLCIFSTLHFNLGMITQSGKQKPKFRGWRKTASHQLETY